MRTRRRVLFLSANMGTGHSCAAQAVYKALKELEPSIDGRIVNSFQYASQLVGKMVEDGYLQLLKSFPTLYGLLYEGRDRSSTVSGMRRWLNQLYLPNFETLLNTYRPHVVVCTHAFPCGVMSAVKEKLPQHVPCVGVVTDFVVHPYWVYENMDRYAVAAPELAAQLMGHGVSASSIHVTGIPIDSRFGRKPSRDTLREELGVNSGLPVVLVMGGGLGMGPVGRILRSLKKIQRPMHVVILTGKNQKLQEQLELEAARLANLAARVQVLGYVENVYDYMNAADLLVTKPGGMTSSEALASGLPMVIVQPLPGQEMRNSKYLLHKKVAIRVPHDRALHATIETLLSDRDTLAHMTAASHRLARPDSARRVAELVMELLEHREEPLLPDRHAVPRSLAPAPLRLAVAE